MAGFLPDDVHRSRGAAFLPGSPGVTNCSARFIKYLSLARCYRDNPAGNSIPAALFLPFRFVPLSSMSPMRILSFLYSTCLLRDCWHRRVYRLIQTHHRIKSRTCFYWMKRIPASAQHRSFRIFFFYAAESFHHSDGRHIFFPPLISPHCCFTILIFISPPFVLSSCVAVVHPQSVRRSERRCSS